MGSGASQSDAIALLYLYPETTPTDLFSAAS